MCTQPLAIALLLSLGLGSCSTLDFRRPVKVSHPVLFTPSGVRYQTVFPGIGEAVAPGDWVRVHYTIEVQGGGMVDSTFTRGIPGEFLIGDAPLAGLNEGLIGMRMGGRRELILPPSLAYGEEGIEGLVPPDASLVCLVELVEISTPDWP